ncbi:MAG: SDR family oxidoreductase [Anaerolineae bacterium]|nr:SDR family oxidoreductase [Anaerolineae bacterium]MDW8068865.1 SDR family oxidoreductase [Anaerolineae bacterium]
MDLSGKVALVTGGAVRVGRAIALGLAGAGVHLALHYHRSASAAQEVVVEARRMGIEAVALPADLAYMEQAQALARAAERHFGRVDIIIHSASPFIRASLLETTPDLWRQVMGVLVDGFFIIARELTPGMVRRGEGSLVVILDRGTVDPWPDFLAHSVGKSALWALARNLAVELAPHVRVNGIVPGPVLPPPDYSEEEQARVAQGTLLERWGCPQDVVDALLYLLRADYITGEVLFVDGGERWAHRRPRRNCQTGG